MRTRSQSGGPAVIQVPSSDNSSSPVSWRCDNRSRLHRGDENCTAGSPPSSSIIDTPAKRMTFEKRRGAHQMQDSQATTEPTPSKAAGSRPRPQARIRGHVTSSVSPAARRVSLPTIREDSVEPANHSNDDDNDNDGFQMTEEDRIPETPQDFPSSPPVPLPQLTADNLSLLQGGQPSGPGAVNAPAAASKSACGLPPASTIVDIPAYVTWRLTQLVRRSRINALQHEAAQERLTERQRELESERERARRGRRRSFGWCCSSWCMRCGAFTTRSSLSLSRRVAGLRMDCEWFAAVVVFGRLVCGAAH
jgi:hypothetical protein